MRKDYEILGIDENADEKAIKRAYFKLIRTHSPEKDPERFQEIRAAYERLTEEKDQPENSISIEVPADDKFAESMYEQIHQLMQEREYGKAAQTAKEGMKYYQEVECFLYLYARCSILDGKPGNAVKSYEKLVKRFPDKLYYQSELAKAYHLRGYTRKAYTVFRQVYDQGWREIDFLNLFSLCCYAQKKCDEAVQVLENLIASIPPEKMAGWIPELLEAYTGLLALYLDKPYPIRKVVDECSAFLDQVGSRIHDYDDLLIQLYLLVKTAAVTDEGEEIDALAEKMSVFVPDIFDEKEPREVTEAYHLLEDERFSDLMKLTMEAFILQDDEGYSEEEYENFMQDDAILCQLEEWPKQRDEIALMQQEYPCAYDCMKDVWDIITKSKGRRSLLKDAILEEYGKKERKYQSGHYYELYPEKRQDMGQVHWDSQEDGQYVRQGKKVGRNDPCPCGSGRKYKNCCGKNG